MTKSSAYLRKKKSAGRLRRAMCDAAAGIDLGATITYVAVPPARAPQPVRSFGAFTEEFARAGRLTCCLQNHDRGDGGDRVCLVPLFQILEARGLGVCLVNAGHFKHGPGCKTDVQDWQWLQYLHSVGLFHASFRPSAAVCAVRSLVRHRESLIRPAANICSACKSPSIK